MVDVLEKYSAYCKEHGISFSNYDSIKAYDASTLFCSAGMQRYKEDFANTNIVGVTIANSQKVLRVNDLDNIGDGFHLAYFTMLGLFSFRDMDVERAIKFWLDFISGHLGVAVDKVTVHPERSFWSKFYPHNIKVSHDLDCTWSDGEIFGYCTEFYSNGIEIGNIVNPLGNCIDVGFGLERIEQLVNGTAPKTRTESLVDAARAIINEGYAPSNVKQGYVLRKILRTLCKENIAINDLPYYDDEIVRQKKIQKKYERLKYKYSNMPPEWWFDTHGINIKDIRV